MSSRNPTPRSSAPVGDADHELMSRIRDGHRASLEVLVRRYWPQLVLYASGFLDQVDEAEDIAQEAFVRVWRHRATWDPAGTVSAYLHRIVRNLALNECRDRRARMRKLETEGVGDLVGSRRARTPLQELDGSRLRAEVDAAVAALPERRRRVFVLCRYHGLTHQEIAESMGTSTQTVANQMSLALTDLRAALGHHLSER